MGKKLRISGGAIYFISVILLSGFLREVVFQDLAISGGPVVLALYWGLIATLFSWPFILVKLFDLFEEESKRRDNHETIILQNDAINNIGLMTAGIVHNFKNYLEVLEATSTMLQKHSEGHRSINRAVTIQKKCLSQAKDTVQQLLWFVKKGEQDRVIQRDLNDILEDAVQLAELLVIEKNIKIVRHFEPLTHKVNVNDIALMQSVINLIKNSAEASKNNSEIIVSTGFMAHEHTYEFCVCVKDFGVGISKDKEELFVPLVSDKANGSGLGLYTVKELVEKDGGRVEVNSEKGEGTEVSLRFPIMH